MTRKEDLQKLIRAKEAEIAQLNDQIRNLPKPIYISVSGIGEFNDRALVVNIDENTGTPSEVVIQFPNSWGNKGQITYKKQ